MYISSVVISEPVPSQPRALRSALSNPPYIAAEEWPALPTTVRCYEPRQALDGGSDGLLFYRRLFAEGPHYLAENGIASSKWGIARRAMCHAC